MKFSKASGALPRTPLGGLQRPPPPPPPDPQLEKGRATHGLSCFARLAIVLLFTFFVLRPDQFVATALIVSNGLSLRFALSFYFFVLLPFFLKTKPKLFSVSHRLMASSPISVHDEPVPSEPRCTSSNRINYCHTGEHRFSSVPHHKAMRTIGNLDPVNDWGCAGEFEGALLAILFWERSGGVSGFVLFSVSLAFFLKTSKQNKAIRLSTGRSRDREYYM